MCKWYLNDPQSNYAFLMTWNIFTTLPLHFFCRNLNSPSNSLGIGQFLLAVCSEKEDAHRIWYWVEWRWLKRSYVKYQFFPYFNTQTPLPAPMCSTAACADQDPGVGEMKGEKLLQFMRPSSVSTRGSALIRAALTFLWSKWRNVQIVNIMPN